MCKFTRPTIPADATADERRCIMFDAMTSLDLSDKCEKRNGLTYLSWANAWNEFKAAYPSATYKIRKNPQTGLPYVSDPILGIIVFTEVTVDDITHEMWLPVMDSKNKAMKEQPYTYQVWDKDKKAYAERTVEAASMFDVNKTLMRCLVKNLAMFGLGLYIYSGDDLPQGVEENASTGGGEPQGQQATTQQKPFDRFAAIKTAINQAQTVSDLMSLYLDHQQEIEANPNVKALLTQRKQQLHFFLKYKYRILSMRYVHT